MHAKAPRHARRAALLLASLFLCAAWGARHASGQLDAAATSSPAPDAPDAKAPLAEYVPGEVLVRFKPDARASAEKGARLSLGVRAGAREINAELERVADEESLRGLYLARVPADETERVIDALRAREDVLYAEPNFVRRKQIVPNDPSFADQWGLKNTGQLSYTPDVTIGRDIHAESAWDITTGSPDVVVGVVDDGVDVFQGDLFPNIWTNPGEIDGNGVDDDGDGYVDDVHGYDFFHNTPQPYPATEHGTHVAGIVGARGNNGSGVAGVNWNVRLMALKVLGTDSEPETTSSMLVAAYAYAKRVRDLWVSTNGAHGANVRVLNNSYGGYGWSQTELDAIRALNDSGVLFVAAAGNSGRNNDLFQFYPAGYELPNVVSVTASSINDNFPTYSNVGARTVHLAAPGDYIWSTVPGGGVASLRGTSMASPMVAGAAALVLAVRPNITVARLRGALLFNGDETAYQYGKTLTGRRLNAYGALVAALEDDATPPAAPGSLAVAAQRGRDLTLTFAAPGDDGATGRASLYEFRYADAAMTTPAQFEAGAPLLSAPLGEPRPAQAGTLQSASVQVPFRHASGFVAVRALDNLGNAGAISNVAVSVADQESDPYTVTESDAAPLSTGGAGVTSADDFIPGYNLPFAFPFYGHYVRSVRVSTNGAIYFSVPPKFLLPPLSGSGGVLDMESSTAALQTNMMIAGLWEDLDVTIYAVTPDPDRVILRWEGVTFNRTAVDGTPRGNQPVKFEIELRRDGTIQLRYGAGSPKLSPVVGISGGAADAYVVASHTAEFSTGRMLDLTNARTVTFTPRRAPAPPSSDLSISSFSHAVYSPNTQNGLAESGAPQVSPGDTVGYAIYLDAAGPDESDGVTLTATLPPNTTFVSCSGYFGTTPCAGPPAGAQGGSVTFTFDRLGHDYDYQHPSVSLKYRVGDGAPPGASLTLAASVSAAQPADPAPANNAASDTITVDARAPFTDAAEISAVSGVSVARRRDGSVWMWGVDPLFTQCSGCGTVTPTKLEQFGAVTSAVATYTNVTALKPDGTVWVYGSGEGFIPVATKPERVSGVSNVRALAADTFVLLAARHDGTVVEWGYTGENVWHPPVSRVQGLDSVRSVFVSDGTRFAIRRDGTVWGWGRNYSGLLGFTSPSDFAAAPAPLAVPAGAVLANSGARAAFVVLADGSVYASGDNSAGLLGDGTTASRVGFARVPGVADVIYLKEMPEGVLAIKRDGTVWGWGASLGLAPRRVPQFDGAVAFARGDGGAVHELALMADGTVRAWGSNNNGQLGNLEAGFASTTPVVVQAFHTLAAPTFSPAGGSYGVPQQVTFGCAGEGVAVRYTTDGGEPTENAPAVGCGSAVFVGQTTTLRAKAFRQGFAPSATASAAYSITQAAPPPAPSIRFAAARFIAFEGEQRALVTVVREGDASAAASADFATLDDQSPVPCNDTTTKPGVAFARCDYATTVSTVRFAAGETQKTVAIPLVDDAHAEPDETVRVRLLGAAGAQLGEPADAAVVVRDDDAASGTSPADDAAFYVRQQYLDFLSREPDAAGMGDWLNLLDDCPNIFNIDPASASARCDRVTVSANFFLSAEFQIKGFYVFRFYKASLGRLPRYTEFTPDTASVTGATSEEVYANKAAFADAWVRRGEFKNLYDAMTNGQFVAALMDRYGLQTITTPDPAHPDGAAKIPLTRADLVNRLNGTGVAMTRAQVVRAVADSDEVSRAEFNSAFVTLQYFGYLRRDPDQSGYNDWSNYLAAHPGDFRTMVIGFVYSPEYRLRFGKP